MKKYIYHILLSVVVLLPLVGCESGTNGSVQSDDSIDYREEMRTFVVEIAEYARSIDTDFVVIPQNGTELLTLNGESDGAPAAAYIAAIDGVGREDVRYGYQSDDTPTPVGERLYMEGFLNRAEHVGVEVLVTDYCTSRSYVDDSYEAAAAAGYISFAAERGLSAIPPYPTHPYNVHSGDVRNLLDAKNFLYLLDPGGFADRGSFIAAIDATDYDVLIIDLFDENGAALTVSEVTALKTKENTGARLVVAYMSIGEAEDYRYYWDPDWFESPPSWLAAENPNWPGNYKVRYWDESWKARIFGFSNAYLDRILAEGFDGVYLDIIDAFEYFE